METPGSRQVLVAGAGIAGLTAALAFAAEGFHVDVCEQAREAQHAGAGIQLSPNATRILAALGVLDLLLPAAVEAGAVVLRDARSLKLLGTVPLGAEARRRWGAPYLVAHRADLHAALTARAAAEPRIRIVHGARVIGASFRRHGVTVALEHEGREAETACRLLVGADGVWSTVRGLVGGAQSRPTGYVAWRSTLQRADFAGKALAASAPGDVVTAFVHHRFHMVAYPLRGGAATNLVLIARGAAEDNAAALPDLLRGTGGALASLAATAAPWTLWPIHEVAPGAPWTGKDAVALVGDAAHAMTPFAAQGAAMAMEDAVALARLVAARPDEPADALAAYEALRRPRVIKVAARGRFNRFAWHARGPFALGRDIVLRLRGGERLAADLDWLYGYDALNPLNG